MLENSELYYNCVEDFTVVFVRNKINPSLWFLHGLLSNYLLPQGDEIVQNEVLFTSSARRESITTFQEVQH